MITFEQIAKANESIRTTDIKGKEYAEVNQRIKAFRMVYPNGQIETSIINLQNGVVLMQARITNEDGVVIGTGYAQEKEESSFINKTSFIENCETSAVGRALGMCGFGIDTSVASAEEVQNAMANQEEPKATPKQIEILVKAYTGDNWKKLLESNNITDIADLPKSKASELISTIMNKSKANKEKKNA